MNEAMGQGLAPAFDPAAGADVPSAGTLLRQAREQAGLHVDTLAATLKVPVRKLEALEADRFDLLPDAVFIRALAASVCRNLKIDPALVLLRLPATGAPRLARTEGGINAPFRSPRDRAGPTWRDQLTRPVFLVVFALLLGALVVVLLPSGQDEAHAVAPPPVAAQPAPEAAPLAPKPTTPDPVVASAATGPLVAGATVAAATTPAAAAAARTVSSAGASVSLAKPAAAAASAPPPAAAAAVAAVASGIVVFKAKAASWVQVTDAKGAVPLRKLLAAGESAAASGALPLAVTVGSASATDVVVHGKPLDLAPLSRDNVARFEVK